MVFVGCPFNVAENPRSNASKSKLFLKEEEQRALQEQLENERARTVNKIVPKTNYKVPNTKDV